MVKENTGVKAPVLLPEKGAGQRTWEPIEKRKVSRATKKKRKYKKRRK